MTNALAFVQTSTESIAANIVSAARPARVGQAVNVCTTDIPGTAGSSRPGIVLQSIRRNSFYVVTADGGCWYSVNDAADPQLCTWIEHVAVDESVEHEVLRYRHRMYQH